MNFQKNVNNLKDNKNYKRTNFPKIKHKINIEDTVLQFTGNNKCYSVDKNSGK